MLEEGWVNITGVNLERRTEVPLLFSEPVVEKFPRNTTMKGILETLLPATIFHSLYKSSCDLWKEQISEGMYVVSNGKVQRKYKKPTFWEFYVFKAMQIYSGEHKISVLSQLVEHNPKFLKAHKFRAIAVWFGRGINITALFFCNCPNFSWLPLVHLIA